MEENENNIVHLPELSITKDKLQEIYNNTFKMSKKMKKDISESLLNKTNDVLSSKEKLSLKDIEIKRIAKKGGLDISSYDINQLIKGYETEKEHGTINAITNITNDDEVKTLKIAIAHLNEVPDYYTKLKKYVEKEINESTYNPWAVCKSSTGKNTGKKLEKCIKSVKKKQGMTESGDAESALIKHKLTIKSSVNNMTPEKIKLTKKFIVACAKELGITKGCNVYLTGERGGPITTTASYNPGSDEIWIYTKNRNMLGDILRSTAHEIRHFKQKLDGVLNSRSGEDGSPHENEANSFSGLMIRKFGKQYIEIYD